jgi:CIC family chloride channel protein
LLLVAVVIGALAGMGAVAFRALVLGITWLFTGHAEFGQAGWAPSAHAPWLGIGFLVLAPIVGGLLYGPLVNRFAPEARGHGVPEVMIAVAENGGRIKPRVALVKSLASALTIGSGGSVGREGPIVQIGAALASGLGQWIRMPENRLRILVACGAGGGIAATFNAPITGVFFAVEVILRELSVESLFAVMISAMVADAVAMPFLGSGSFLRGFPIATTLHDPRDYLLVTALAVLAALIGLGFSKSLYLVEDLLDRLWRGRPEWARPAVGGVLVGLLLLALPQMYGVGYPVMFRALDGDYALWFLVVLAVGKIVATSLTLGVGGSGGIFAPSLFVGLMSGTAFGVAAQHLFGPAAGDPALYAAVGMAGVFSSATRAPLTSLSSIVEMTGDFTLTLPIMLTVGIATALSRGLSYATIYTGKLLRRGQDIDRSTPWRALSWLTAADTMHPLPYPIRLPLPWAAPTASPAAGFEGIGRVILERDPQVVSEGETVADIVHQLDAFSPGGLPVVSGEATEIRGWVTPESIVGAIRTELRTHRPDPTQQTAGEGLPGYRHIEVVIDDTSEIAGRPLGDISWPGAGVLLAVARKGRRLAATPDLVLERDDRLTVLFRR